MTETVIPHHIEPENVVQLAAQSKIIERDSKGNSLLETCETVGGGEAFVVRNFHENFNNPKVNSRIKKLTGITSIIMHDTVEKFIPISGQGGWTRKDGTIIENNGDSLILDPRIKGEPVEFTFVGETVINKQPAEWALVRMWDYGALKQLVFPEPEPDNPIRWEMAMSLKGESLNFVIPAHTENRGGKFVTLDDGVNLQLHPGDAVFLPITVRQVIAGSPSEKYFYISAPWGGEKGLIQKPVYWRSQISK